MLELNLVKNINIKLQMNQTEIRKYSTSYQATCSDNFQNISLSNQSSAITVIKGNSYGTNRDITPKADISLRKNSSNKMIRVSSSKGINVISIRPSSQQNQVEQFSSTNNISNAGSSETTIKIQGQHRMQMMKQQIKKAVQIYEDKMNQEISYQHNYLTVQVERLKQLLVINQSKLAQQNQQLGELLSRVEIVQRKVQAKTNLMVKQLNQFKRFYDQCYHYTVKRIADAELSMKSVTKYVEEATSTLSSVESWKYVQYANSLVKSIVTTCSAQSSSLKYYLDQQIFELELGLGKFYEKYQEIDKIVYEMKSTKFSNESLKDSIKDLGKFAIVTNNLRKDQHKQNFLEYYEPKFKQIIKRVNNSTIQIDLIKGLIQTDMQSLAHTKKLQQLTQKITTLQAKLEDQKSIYQKQLANKQQILSQSNPRILELETKLHANVEHQAKLLKQISQLKHKISYYQTKCEKNSERQYGIQSTMAQAFAQTLVKQKTNKFIEQRTALTQKLCCLQQKISKLDHQNYLLAQKLSKTQDIRIQNAKLDTQLKYTSKLLQQYEQNQHKQDKLAAELKKQNVCLLATVQDMKNQIKIFEDRIQDIMKQNKEINRDDDQYFRELEEEVEKCSREIEKLECINEELLIKNKQLMQRNHTLEQDLHHYAQTFQKQSITFRTALQNLQKEKDLLTSQNNKLSQQTKSLKQDIENTRTMQSFYQNNSNISLQLRKTVSSDLTGCMTNVHGKTPKKKVQRKTFSSKDNDEGDGKIEELRGVLRKMGCMFPVVCGIDQNGYLRDQRTGCYFVDSRQNYFLLGQEELTEAVKNGLILL